MPYVASVAAKSFPASAELCEYLGEGEGVTVDIYAVPGGYVFSYGRCVSGHGLYGRDAETPFADLSDAEATAVSTSDEAKFAEFDGEVGDLYGDGEPASGSY